MRSFFDVGILMSSKSYSKFDKRVLNRAAVLKNLLNKTEIAGEIEVKLDPLSLALKLLTLRGMSPVILIEKGRNFSLETPNTLQDVIDILEEKNEPISLLGIPNRSATIWLDEIYNAQSGSNGRLGIFLKIFSNVQDDYIVVAAPLDLTVTGQRHELTEADLRELFKNIPGLERYAGRISISEAEVRMRIQLLRESLSRISDDTTVVSVETGTDFCNFTPVPQNFGQLMSVIEETLTPTGVHPRIQSDEGSALLFNIYGNNPQRGISARLDEIRVDPWQGNLGVFMGLNRLIKPQDYAQVAVPLGITVTGQKLEPQKSGLTRELLKKIPVLPSSLADKISVQETGVMLPINILEEILAYIKLTSTVGVIEGKDTLGSRITFEKIKDIMEPISEGWEDHDIIACLKINPKNKQVGLLLRLSPEILVVVPLGYKVPDDIIE